MTESAYPVVRGVGRRPSDLGDLPFTPRPAVRWFNPPQLLHTLLQVALADVFASYSDKREVQAALAVECFHDHSAGTELWLDYVADLGDGFDATHSVAQLLARPRLDLDHDGAAVRTERGGLLVLGGDEVYPTPSTTAYEDRTKGPYAAALPHTDPSPTMYAVPGNHDWYDGLTAFLRVFCQRAWIGGWQTRQRRSYFALKLPHGWWLLGLDSQLNSYLDGPQLDYFRAVVEHIGPDDAVVVATASPTWVRGGSRSSGGRGRGPDEHRALDFFLERVLGGDSRVRLMVSGDLHHYARYAERDGGRQLVTCGGGGAYLSATHARPDDLLLPPPALHVDETDPPVTAAYDLVTSYPSVGDSRRLARHVVHRLGTRNRAFLLLMIGVQGVLAHAVLAGASSGVATLGGPRPRDLDPELVGAAFRSPGLLLTSGAVVVAFCLLSAAQGTVGKVCGAVHGAAHVGLTVLACLVVWRGALEEQGVVEYVGRLALVGVVAGLAATVLTGLYLWLMSLGGRHLNEVFSAQSIEGWKSFLRLHLTADGDLVVHPVGLQEVCRDWVATLPSPGRPGSRTRPRHPLRPHLIEGPVVISKRSP